MGHAGEGSKCMHGACWGRVKVHGCHAGHGIGGQWAGMVRGSIDAGQGAGKWGFGVMEQP